MKQILLISSLRLFINDPLLLEQCLGKPLKGLRVAYVINATKGVTDLAYFERNKKFFNKQEVNFTEIDLNNLKEPQLRELLPKFEAVYVEGGNSFYLIRSIRESGFEKVVKDLIPKGLIYIGGSAGAYVACPLIEMADWKGPNKYDHYGVTDFTGMGLVDFLVFVHYTPEVRDLIKEKIFQAKFPVKILTDDQAILVQDDNIILIEK